MEFALNLPINQVSFGQISVGILREVFKRGLNPLIFPVANRADLSSQVVSSDFANWLQDRCNRSYKEHNRETPVFKLWHFQGSLETFSNKQYLLTFYELDEPTETEINIARNQEKILVTSEYTKTVFEVAGLNHVEKIPLFFDRNNFNIKLDEKGIKKKYFFDDRITFNLVGKLEKRKHHEKVIKAWVKKFGNNSKYHLQCAVYNPFFHSDNNKCVEMNNQEYMRILDGRGYSNVHFLPFMQKNSDYNDFLNSADIILAMSGAEGWGLPEMHSVALGKHAVVLNAHAYKEWADSSNCTFVNPTKKIPAYDGRFFVQGQPWNQGNIFDFEEDEFISACEAAIEKVEKNRVNEEGVKLQDKFTVDKTVDKILSNFCE